MSELLAKRVIAEVPVSQLQEIVAGIDKGVLTRSAENGGLCGCGCDGWNGWVCGLACTNISRATVGVIDPANRSGITKVQLEEARGKVMQFKDDLLAQARISGINLR